MKLWGNIGIFRIFWGTLAFDPKAPYMLYNLVLPLPVYATGGGMSCLADDCAECLLKESYEKVFLQLEGFPHNNLTIPHLPCFLDFQFPEQDRYKAPCTEQRWLFLDLSQSCSGTKLNWGNFTGFISIYWSISCWCVTVYAGLYHTASHQILWYSNYVKLAVTPCM